MAAAQDDFGARSERAWQLAGEANERMPAADGWGFFSSSPPPSGLGAFSWFDSRGELLDFLSEHAPYLFGTGDDGPEGTWTERVERFRASVVRAQQESGALDGVLAAAHTEVDPHHQLDWIGAVADLISGRSAFAVRLRSDFADSLDDAELDPEEPVPPELVDDFLDTLQAHGY